MEHFAHSSAFASGVHLGVVHAGPGDDGEFGVACLADGLAMQESVGADLLGRPRVGSELLGLAGSEGGRLCLPSGRRSARAPSRPCLLQEGLLCGFRRAVVVVGSHVAFVGLAILVGLCALVLRYCSEVGVA